jgi:hypothetical protein
MSMETYICRKNLLSTRPPFVSLAVLGNPEIVKRFIRAASVG